MSTGLDYRSSIRAISNNDQHRWLSQHTHPKHTQALWSRRLGVWAGLLYLSVIHRTFSCRTRTKNHWFRDWKRQTSQISARAPNYDPTSLTPINIFIQVNPLPLLEASLSHRQPLTKRTISYTFVSGLMRNPIQNDHTGQKGHTQWRHAKQDRLKRYWTPPTWTLSTAAWDVSVWLSTDLSGGLVICEWRWKEPFTSHQQIVRFSCLDFVLREERTGPDLNQTLIQPLLLPHTQIFKLSHHWRRSNFK